MVIPYTTQNQKAAEAWINYVYDRANYAKLVAFVQYVPVLSDMTDELNKIDPGLASNPLVNPPQDDSGQGQGLARRSPTSKPRSSTPRTPPSPAADQMAGVATSSRQRSKIAPYLMILPALAYLGVFFVVPFISLAQTRRCHRRAARCICRR